MSLGGQFPWVHFYTPLCFADRLLQEKSDFVTIIDIDDNAMLVCFSYMEQWKQTKMQFSKGI